MVQASLSLKKWTRLDRSAGYSRQENVLDMETPKEVGSYNGKNIYIFFNFPMKVQMTANIIFAQF